MPVEPLEQRFLQGLGDAATRPLGLAVSGGGDSMAMLHMAKRLGLAVRVATVDHGLRAESAAEAEMVARVCADLDVPYQLLRWQGWDGRGNLQDQARMARRRLLADWARRDRLTTVALAHSRDDVAETFLMRLARGAGVDGLSSMVPRWEAGGLAWVRPLLTVSRVELRGLLREIGAEWVEDPSNAALRFDRVKARAALVALAPLGLRAETIAEVASHLGQARAALEVATMAAARESLIETSGILRILPVFFGLPDEIRRKLLQRVILWMVPGPYAPRGTAVQGALARLASGKSAQLAGCHFLCAKDQMFAFREARAVANKASAQDGIWDNRWRIEGPAVAGAEIRALGAAGLAQIADWRGLVLPRAVLLSQPALWLGDRVVAAPCAAAVHPASGNWRAICDPAPTTLFQSALSH